MRDLKDVIVMVETAKVVNEKLATALILAVGAISFAAFIYWVYVIFV